MVFVGCGCIGDRIKVGVGLYLSVEAIAREAAEQLTILRVVWNET
jgi:hypothetical protein